jgi:hypothetical protein
MWFPRAAGLRSNVDDKPLLITNALYVGIFVLQDRGSMQIVAMMVNACFICGCFRAAGMARVTPW